MSLLEQFRVFIGTIVISMFFCFIYSIFNRLFYKFHKTIIRFVFETILLILMLYIYFLFLVLICDAKLNIHYLLAALIGVYIYCSFYAFYFNRYLEIKAKYLYKKYLLPIKIKIDELYGIIKKIKRRTKNAEKKDTNL